LRNATREKECGIYLALLHRNTTHRACAGALAGLRMGNRNAQSKSVDGVLICHIPYQDRVEDSATMRAVLSATEIEAADGSRAIRFDNAA
jgi:hypothetical protein